MKLSYSVDEAAQALGTGRNLTYNLIASGALASFTIGRRRFVSAEALQAYVRQREESARAVPISAEASARARVAVSARSGRES